ncbi:hypothetical protein JYQ62_19650 [Nostoc sp. UHCC 0702]|nr:hypothetical protein JYQ62_19650 [Nostoc sp. UHCC 0702]
MTHSDTITKKRYTLREVQALATKVYDLLVQPITSRGYGIYFEGQLVAQAKRLADVVAVLPQLYTAIQEQLAEQQKEIAPAMAEANCKEQSCNGGAIAQAEAINNECTKNHVVATLEKSEDTATGNFSHHAYEDSTNWEFREQLNERGYRDAIARIPSVYPTGPYRAGYLRGVRDRS